MHPGIGLRGIVLGLLAVLCGACTTPEVTAPVERPALPSGPGPLLGDRILYPQFVADLERLGMNMISYRAQDAQQIDVGQDVAFVAAEEVRDLRLATLTGAETVADDFVVLQYQGDSCVVPVAGATRVTDAGVAVSFFSGTAPSEDGCLARMYTYRATLYVPGAREGDPVLANSTTAPGGVMLPLLSELPEIVIWPDELPAP